VRQHGTGTA